MRFASTVLLIIFAFQQANSTQSKNRMSSSQVTARQSTMNGLKRSQTIDVRVDVTTDTPDLIAAIEKFQNKQIVNDKFMYSSMFVDLTEVFQAGLSMMSSRKVFESMQVFFINFYTAVAMMMNKVKREVGKVNGKSYVVYVIPVDCYKEFNDQLQIGLSNVNHWRTSEQKDATFRLFAEYLSSLDLHRKLSIHVQGQNAIELTYYGINDRGVTFTDFERQQKFITLFRVLTLGNKIVDETYKFLVPVKSSIIYKNVLTIGSFLAYTATLATSNEEAKNLEGLVTAIVEMFDSAVIKRSSFNEKKAFYSYYKVNFDKLVHACQLIINRKSDGVRSEKEELNYQIFRDKVEEFLELLNSKIKPETEITVREGDATEEAALLVQTQVIVKPKLSERQKKLIKSLLNTRTDPNSFIYQDNTAYLHIFVQSLLERAFELVETEPLPESLLEALECTLEAAEKTMTSSRFVEQAEDPLVTVAMAFDSQTTDQLIGKELPKLRESINKLIEDSSASTDDKYVKALSSSLKDLQSYAEGNVQKAGSYAIEAVDYYKSQKRLCEKMAAGQLTVNGDTITVQRDKKVKVVYLFEVVECAKCNNDHSLKI